MFRFLRRKWITRRPFPEEWAAILRNHAPVYPFLPEAAREKLHRHLQVFLDEKIFEGCGGLTMTDERRLVIAAYACMLILEEPSGYYPALQAILVYPDRYVAPVNEEREGGIVEEGWEGRAGESWNPGNIVLSWNDIESDLKHSFEGKNLIYHEFAHQIDFRYGLSAGIDVNGNTEAEEGWSVVLAGVYRDLHRKAQSGRRGVLDHYGATHPAECFAVSVECFMENPRGLRREYPRLYEQLSSLLALDPDSFIPGGGRE